MCVYPTYCFSDDIRLKKLIFSSLQGLTGLLVQRYIRNLNIFLGLMHLLSFLAVRLWRRAFKDSSPRFYAEYLSSQPAQKTPHWLCGIFASWVAIFVFTNAYFGK